MINLGHDYQFYVSLLLQTLAPDLRVTPTHVVEQMTTPLGLAAGASHWVRSAGCRWRARGLS